MPSKRTSNPRVRIHANRKATLSGLNYDDLRSLLTAAWLHHHDCTKGADKRSVEWHMEQMTLLDVARASMDAAIRGTYGPSRPPTKKERLAKVRGDIAFRKHMDAVTAHFAEIDAGRADR
jgi:hypothetical protein